jgi:hypothetical protein
LRPIPRMSHAAEIGTQRSLDRQLGKSVALLAYYLLSLSLGGILMVCP